MNNFFSAISAGFMPVMAAVIIGYGFFKKAPVYDLFIEGAKDGLKTAVEILPFMIGIYIAVNGLTVSGFLDFIYIVFEPAFRLARIPVEILPLIFLRAISGSGSFIILQNILEIAGPDSFAGRAACSMSSKRHPFQRYSESHTGIAGVMSPNTAIFTPSRSNTV